MLNAYVWMARRAQRMGSAGGWLAVGLGLVFPERWGVWILVGHKVSRGDVCGMSSAVRLLSRARAFFLFII